MHTQRSFLFCFAGTLAAVLLLGAGVPPQAAQAQQAGYIQQDVILSQMPEMQQAQKQLQKEIQSQRQELQSKQKELQQKVQKFQKQSQMLSEESRQQRRQELQQQQQQIQQSVQERDQQMSQRRRELMQPVFEKFQGAVDAVASSQSLDFVIRDQALLYVNDTEMVNITEDVASRLGVELPANASAPASSGR